VIKLFATASIRDGGNHDPDEGANRCRMRRGEGVGLHSAVHAHASDGARLNWCARKASGHKSAGRNWQPLLWRLPGASRQADSQSAAGSQPAPPN